MMSKTLRIAAVLISMVVISQMVVLANRPVRMAPMELDMVGCMIDGTHYSFSILIPDDEDVEIYSAQFCNSIRNDYDID